MQPFYGNSSGVARSKEIRGLGRTPYVDIADSNAWHDCGGVLKSTLCNQVEGREGRDDSGKSLKSLGRGGVNSVILVWDRRLGEYLRQDFQ